MEESSATQHSGGHGQNNQPKQNGIIGKNSHDNIGLRQKRQLSKPPWQLDKGTRATRWLLCQDRWRALSAEKPRYLHKNP